MIEHHYRNVRCVTSKDKTKDNRYYKDCQQRNFLDINVFHGFMKCFHVCGDHVYGMKKIEIRRFKGDLNKSCCSKEGLNHFRAEN